MDSTADVIFITFFVSVKNVKLGTLSIHFQVYTSKSQEEENKSHKIHTSTAT